MSKLLPTRLPAFDPSFSSHYNLGERDSLQFSTGSIIFNTTNMINQAYDGVSWRNLYEHQTYPTGVSISASLGSVTVTTP